MATTLRNLKGWQFFVGSEAADGDSAIDTPRRSSRRAAAGATKTQAETSITLRRDLDNLELKQGDCILLENEHDDSGVPDLALIKEISFGTDNFLDVKVFTFFRMNDVDFTKLPDVDENELKEDQRPSNYYNNEVFLTPVTEKVFLKDVIGSCKVISENTLKNIVVDESIADTIFVCRRLSDNKASYFTQPVDWDELMGLLMEDPTAFYHSIKSMTVRPAYGKPLGKADDTPVATPRKRAAIKKINYAESDDDKDDDDVFESEEESQAESDQSEDEFEPPRQGSPNKRKKTQRAATPNRQKRSKTKSLSRTVTPRKKPLSSKATVWPSVARRLNFFEQEDEELVLDYSEVEEEVTEGEVRVTKVFRKAKRRLHPSAKLNSLPCRDVEFHQIYSSLENAVQTQTSRCIYVSGTPGVGKTATIREVIKQLSANLSSVDEKAVFNYIEINGLKLMTPQSAYEMLWHKISGKRVNSASSLTLLEEYFEEEDPDRQPLVVLLDELDQVVTKNQTVMYNFFNWPSYPNSKLIVIAVANTMDLPERLLTNKISSRLGLTRIQFPGYTFTQLSEIIKHRLERLSRANENKLVISKDAIEFASRKVASVSGDARRSLIICVRAIEIAEMEFLSKPKEEREQLGDKYTVTITHIMKAVNETTSSPITNYLNSLSFTAKMFLAAILLRRKRTGVAEVSLGEVIDELNNQFHLIMFTELRALLKKEEMELLDVIYYDNSSRIRVNGFSYILQDLEENGIVVEQSLKAERARLIRLNVSEDEILSCFKKDSLLKDLVIAT